MLEWKSLTEIIPHLIIMQRLPTTIPVLRWGIRYMIPGIGTGVHTIMVDGTLPIITIIPRIPVGRTTRPRIILTPLFTMAAPVQVATIQGMAVTPWIHVTSETREVVEVELERGEEVALALEPATRMGWFLLQY